MMQLTRWRQENSEIQPEGRKQLSHQPSYLSLKYINTVDIFWFMNLKATQISELDCGPCFFLLQRAPTSELLLLIMLDYKKSLHIFWMPYQCWQGFSKAFLSIIQKWSLLINKRQILPTGSTVVKTFPHFREGFVYILSADW